MDPLHPDPDLQRQDQRRRLLRDRAAADRGQLGRPRRRALLVLVPLDADVHDLDRLPARGLPRPAVARLHRGDRLHLHGPRQRRPGRRPRPVRADLRLHELRDRGPGPRAPSTSSTGSTTAPPCSTRGRHGRHRDVGAGQADGLPRPPDQAQHRRLGPPPRRLLVRDAAAGQRHPGLRDREHRRRGHARPPRACSAATRRRAPTSTTSSAPTSSSRRPTGKAYPVGDVSGEEAAAQRSSPASTSSSRTPTR